MIVMPVVASPASIARTIGAAPRQRGSFEGVDVEATVTRPGEDRLGEDQSVRGDHQHVERIRQRLRARGLGPERRRLQHRDTERGCKRLDRRRLELQASAFWTIGLREHQRYRVSGAGDRLQRARRERRSTGKADAHGLNDLPRAGRVRGVAPPLLKEGAAPRDGPAAPR